MDNNTIKAIFESGGNFALEIKTEDLLKLGDYLVAQTRASTIEECQRNARAEDATMTATEVCEFFKINKTTLWRWNKSGVLTHNKMGKKRLYRRTDIDKLYNSKEGNYN